MKYEITERGILFQIEDDIADAQAEIPIADAVKVCHNIAAKIEALDDDCECERQGAQPCGNCDRPPLSRPA